MDTVVYVTNIINELVYNRKISFWIKGPPGYSGPRCESCSGKNLLNVDSFANNI